MTQLESAGCKHGDLKLFVIIHGDHDHVGNCAYFQGDYGAKIAMHADGLGMVEHGDMGWNRKTKPDKISFVFRIMGLIVEPLFKPGKFETFEPNFTINDGFDFSGYGFDAQALHLPGHLKGSIGILTADGDLFCEDLVYNFFGKPGCLYINDLTDYNASIEKQKKN